MSDIAYEDLRAALSARYRDLSARLQQIAQYALDNPNDMALETVAVIAERARVQPSALIRFARAFGFSGFSEMQRVFRTRLVGHTPQYRDRIRRLHDVAEDDIATTDDVLAHFVVAGIEALHHLREDVSPRFLDRALALLAKAQTIHVTGQRRAFGTASYLAYGLGQLGCASYLIDNVGGMIEQQAQRMSAHDALIVISFAPYAPETLVVAQRAAEIGIPIVAITDSPGSPLNPLATVSFQIKDAEVRGFRSLSATMCLAVTLVVGLGQKLEEHPENQAKPRRRKQSGAA